LALNQSSAQVGAVSPDGLVGTVGVGSYRIDGHRDWSKSGQAVRRPGVGRVISVGS